MSTGVALSTAPRRRVRSALLLSFLLPVATVTASPARSEGGGSGFEGSGFEGLVPARVLDTRSGVGVSVGRVGAGGVVEMEVLGRGGVPSSGVEAVALNLTAVDASVGTFVTAWPSGAGRPVASVLNPSPGGVSTNFVVVPVGEGGRVSLFNDAGEVELLADVMGWFPGSGSVGRPPSDDGSGGADDGSVVPRMPQDLLDRLAEVALAAQGGFDVEDVLVAGLLWYQASTGVVPLTAADVLLENVRDRIPRWWRIQAYRAFWLGFSNVEWHHFPMVPEDIPGWWETWFIVKFTYRQNAINHFLSGFVASEEAWRATMSDVRAWEEKWFTEQQISDAVVDGWRTIEDTETLLAAVDYLL